MKVENQNMNVSIALLIKNRHVKGVFSVVSKGFNTSINVNADVSKKDRKGLNKILLEEGSVKIQHMESLELLMDIAVVDGIAKIEAVMSFYISQSVTKEITVTQTLATDSKLFKQMIQEINEKAQMLRMRSMTA